MKICKEYQANALLGELEKTYTARLYLALYFFEDGPNNLKLISPTFYLSYLLIKTFSLSEEILPLCYVFETEIHHTTGEHTSHLRDVTNLSVSAIYQTCCFDSRYKSKYVKQL